MLTYFVGENSPNRSVTGKYHGVLQNRQFAAILLVDNVPHDRRTSVAFNDAERVSSVFGKTYSIVSD